MSKYSQSTVSRAVQLNGHEVISVIAICKSVRGMPTEYAQAFLASVWTDWRNNDESAKNVMNGLATFFDMYFAFKGDFSRIEETIIRTLPPDIKEEALADAQSMADRNIAMVKDGVKACETHVDVIPLKGPAFVMPNGGGVN